MSCGKHGQPHGLDCRAAFEEGASDPVHSIHDPAVGSQDDRMGGVDFHDKADVIHNVPDSGPLELIEPVHRVDLVDVGEGYLLDREVAGQPDQAIDVPGVCALLAGPEVVLLAHGDKCLACTWSWDCNRMFLILRPNDDVLSPE
jgi:hypothetical protein